MDSTEKQLADKAEADAKAANKIENDAREKAMQEKAGHNPAYPAVGDSATLAQKQQNDRNKVVTGKEYNALHKGAEATVPDEATRVSGEPGRTYSTTPAGYEATTQTLPKNPVMSQEALNRAPIHNPAPFDHLDRVTTTNRADSAMAAEVDQHDEKVIPKGQSYPEQFAKPAVSANIAKEGESKTANVSNVSTPGVPKVDPSLPFNKK